MKFDPESWKVWALEFAHAAEIMATRSENLVELGNVKAVGADNDRPTLLDSAIAGIVPESVAFVEEVLEKLVEELVSESVRLYDTGERYRDVELDNTLAGEKLTEMLGDTVYNP